MKVIILIDFQLINKNLTIKLRRLHFFKNLNDTRNFIERENLEILDNKEILSSDNIQNLIELINRYCSGEKIELFEKITELDIKLEIQEIFPTNFSQNVAKSLLNIKHGEISTYSQIGNIIGSKAFRAIGNICKSNPIPLIIPCHRVLRKDGNIGGFMGKSEKTWETSLKKKLLKIEGYRGKNSTFIQSKLI